MDNLSVLADHTVTQYDRLLTT